MLGALFLPHKAYSNVTDIINDHENFKLGKYFYYFFKIEIHLKWMWFLNYSAAQNIL